MYKEFILGLFAMYLIYSFFFNQPTQKEQIQNQQRKQPTQQSQQQAQIKREPIRQPRYQTQSSSLLEKADYSIERELVVDPSDDAFYREHFDEFAQNGFEDYGINAKVNPLDSGYGNFAKFDRNDKGYLGTNAQNVHSSLVQDTIKNKYRKVKTNNHTPDEKIAIEIISYAKPMRKNWRKIQNVVC